MTQANLQSLLAKVTGGIDDDGLSGVFDQNRHAQAFVAGSAEVQVSQSQAIEGTPVEVPVPRKVSFISSLVRKPASLFGGPPDGNQFQSPA